MADWKAIGPHDFLADGQMTEVTVDGFTLLIARVEGRYYAVDGLCPHLHGHLANGQRAGYIVSCPRHGSAFDLRTGENIKWTPLFPPMVRKVSQVVRKPADLDNYPIRVEQGELWVQLP